MKTESENELAKLEELVVRLANRMEKLQLAEYVELFRQPGRLFWMNVLAGVGRGVGAAIGFTLITGVIIYVLQRVVMLNLPVISDFVVHLITLIRQRGGF
jgi:hypothetical protein